MTHRKTKHPSQQRCRYYLKQACIFETDDCWYMHPLNSGEKSVAGSSGYACNKCGVIVAENGDLKKHMKECHPRTVAICRKFIEGNCNLSDKSCWFLHVEQDFKNEMSEDQATLDEASDVDGKNDKHVDEEQKMNDSVFYKAQVKAPPDQMSQLIEIVKNMALQVMNIEKITQNIQ